MMSLTLGSNPVVGPQLLHGHSLPGVHSEQALRLLTNARRVFERLPFVHKLFLNVWSEQNHSSVSLVLIKFYIDAAL